MSPKRVYSDEFKEKLFKEYNEGELGYKRLAQKYDLTRDAIRGIIIGMKKKKEKAAAKSAD